MSSKTKSIKVFLVDDHVMVREGLKVLFDSSDDIRVCGEAGSIQDAFSKLPKCKPNILLLDVRLPGETGLEGCRRFKSKFPDLSIIMLTSYIEPGMVMEAIDSGASGYLLKEIDPEQLCNSVRQVAAGQTALPANVAQELIHSVQADKKKNLELQRLETLSPQEHRVAKLVASGLMNKEIADQLKLSEKTIKNYLTSIFAKLNISRRSQLAVIYSKQN
ncbi:MAG: response regulator transcription factor [Verrucomicrobiota bacterium]